MRNGLKLNVLMFFVLSACSNEVQFEEKGAAPKFGLRELGQSENSMMSRKSEDAIRVESNSADTSQTESNMESLDAAIDLDDERQISAENQDENFHSTDTLKEALESDEEASDKSNKKDILLADTGENTESIADEDIETLASKNMSDSQSEEQKDDNESTSHADTQEAIDTDDSRVRGELPPSSHRTVRTGPYTALHVNQAR